MTSEQIPTKENVPFPREELKSWVEAHYLNQKDEDSAGLNKYIRELKGAHLSAIDNRNIEGLRKIYNIMFIERSRLQGKFPEEFKVLNDLCYKLNDWLDFADKSN